MSRGERTRWVDAREHAAFIPAALDDAALDVYAFRLYCRIVRRAGYGGEHWESVPAMAAGVGMSERRARTALRELERRGMVACTQREGATSVYVLLPQSSWSADSETPASHAGTPAPRAGVPRHHVPPTPAPGAAKGTPMKVLPKKEQTNTSSAAPTRAQHQPFMDAWNDNRGPLPPITALNDKRKRAIRSLIKEHGEQGALDMLRDATRAVAQNDFWRDRKYGFDNLVPSKVMQYAERHRATEPDDLFGRTITLEDGTSGVICGEVGGMWMVQTDAGTVRIPAR